MDIKIDVLDICPYCLGTGKLKVMQSVSISNIASIRGRDKK